MAAVAVPDEEECYLWAILSDPSGLDQAEFMVTDETTDDGCFRAWPFQWAWWRNTAARQIEQGSRCLSEGTQVLTSTGWKSIETVQLGDLVLTHKNRWRPVTEVFDNGIREVVEIKGQGHPDSLKLTPDHELLARHARRASQPKDGHKGKKMSSPEWVASQDWIWNDGSQIMTTSSASPAAQFPSLGQEWRWVEQAYKSGRQNYIPDALNDDWLWLYGLFIAEGYSYVSDIDGKIKWCLHKDEITHVTGYLDRLGLRYSVDNPKDNGRNIQVNSRPLAKWLREHTGHYSWEKRIAPWVFALPENQRQLVFDGIVYGDGWTRASGRIEYSTTSRRLVLDLRLLAQSLGYSFCVSMTQAKEAVIEGRTISCRDSYSCGIELLEGRKQPNFIFEDGIAWSALKSVTEAGTAHTWDLEVKDDHSFVAEGFVVHNSSGKSLSVRFRALAFPFIHAGQEMVVTAPEGNHLDALTDNIENVFVNNRLASEMLVGGRNGIKHRPFHCNFRNGARIMGRIPQRDGKGVKGIHPIWLELDEGQDYPEAGWLEIIETVKRGDDRAQWRAHGVTRGVRDKFYEYTQPDSGWEVHHYPAMYRPTWNEEERREKVQLYGNRDSPDYRRNVLGLHGDAQSPLFVLHRLMEAVDADQSSDYNLSEYWEQTIDEATVRDNDGNALALLNPPLSHSNYKRIWIGADIGYTQAPTAIVIFAEQKPTAAEMAERNQLAVIAGVRGSKKVAKTELKLIGRIMLKRVAHENQVQVIMWLIDHYRPQAFAMDRTGLGLPLFQDIQNHVRQNDRLKFVLDRIKGYNFSEKLVVDFDDVIEIDENDPKGYEKAEIKRNVLEYSSDVLRGLVDDGQIRLPWDKELIGEFRGQTWTYDKSTIDMYGRRKMFSAGSFHTLDGCRMAVLAWKQAGIEQFFKAQEDTFYPSDAIILDL
jgi:hypothetical protein